MLLHVVLAFALAVTLVLAAVLWLWADRVAGARLLVLFLLGVGVWVVGNELPNWLGPEVEPLAIRMVSLAPLVSAVFVHFCVVFCKVPLRRPWLVAVYALGGASTLLAQVRSPGRLIHSPPLGWVAVPNDVGLIASAGWVVLGIAGLSVLARGWMRARGAERLQIAAVTASCVWGAVCLTGYAMAAARVPGTPWPLFGLPAYTLILVYGILRYRVFVVNAWARRAVAWTLLLALGAAVVALAPLLPVESRWVGGMLVAGVCLGLNGPVRQIAERLVFPGGQVSAADLRAWAIALEAAESRESLATRASDAISERLGLRVPVHIGPEPGALRAGDVPALVCRPADGGWQTDLTGWSAAPPGPRRVAELFGSVLADAAARLERAQALASRERERQLQDRLAELGALAATVAHDIRNPLNIISMAVAAAAKDTRQEVAHQVGRISHLADDLLDYAKPWTLSTVRFDLAERVRSLVRRWPHARVGPGLQAPLLVDADPRRLDQALTNLLENASRAVHAVAAHGDDDDAAAPPGVEIDADVDHASPWLRLQVSDDGPGVPDAMRERLFEPFASRSPGGTGLGLAIVARIAKAHGGEAMLEARPPWSTTFSLRLPIRTP